jgi:hypothetical protein
MSNLPIPKEALGSALAPKYDKQRLVLGRGKRCRLLQIGMPKVRVGGLCRAPKEQKSRMEHRTEDEGSKLHG